MKREYVKIGGKNLPVVRDTVLIGDWSAVESLPLSSVTKNDEDTEMLSGLIIKGYEMKWGETNGNYERYEKTAFDEFIEDYFVTRKLNMPVTLMHGWGYNDICGRVLYIERNSVGFYFVVYVPKTYADYDRVLWGLQEGLLQGFSKEGYATDWDYKYKEDGEFDYELVKSMKLCSVSLVSLPANGVPFEKIQEIRQNALRFVKEDEEVVEEKKPLTIGDF